MPQQEATIIGIRMRNADWLVAYSVGKSPAPRFGHEAVERSTIARGSQLRFEGGAPCPAVATTHANYPQTTPNIHILVYAHEDSIS